VVHVGITGESGSPGISKVVVGSVVHTIKGRTSVVVVEFIIRAGHALLQFPVYSAVQNLPTALALNAIAPPATDNKAKDSNMIFTFFIIKSAF
jgi:hypothetical protein